MQREAMKRILLDAYAHPARRSFFYSANGARTGSERLNRMTCWDWTPEPSVYVPGVSTCMFPLALGCPPAITSSGSEWVAPRITDPAQVADFEIPDAHAGRTGQVLANIAELVRKLPEGHRIREPDIQSPLGVAELMWDDSFYLALLERPDAVRALLEKITDFIIAFIREVKRIAGPRLNGAGFPCVWGDETGTMIADDTMSLLSPEMHLEFSVPHVNRIADACGPLYYHSCTWRAHYFANIHQIRSVRAYNWNPGNSDDPQAVTREFSGKAVIALHLVLDMHLDDDVLALGKGFADEAEFLRYMMDGMRDDTCMYFWFSNIVQNGPVMDKIYDLLHERGCTPQAWGLA